MSLVVGRAVTPDPVRVAAIDCGTNAVRLLIADIDATGVLHDVERTMRIVRLGEGVDATGEFSAAALQRTFAALDQYAGLIHRYQPRALRFVATSASRDVRNRAAFIDGVRERIGVPPEVISGAQEAGLSFLGATRGLPVGLLDPRQPVLVVDIGGGSTEFVRGLPTSPSALAAVSVDIGCVRMTERHLHGDPPTAAQVAAADADIAAAIAHAGSQVPLTGARLVAVSGTATTVAAAAMDLPDYDPERLHGAVITARSVDAVAATLLAMTREQRAALPYMHPGRVDVIGGGAMVLRQVVTAAHAADVVISETDILDGIAYRLA